MGTSTLSIPLAAGSQSFIYYVQGLEGATSQTSTLTATAPGYANSNAVTVSVVQPSLNVNRLPGSTTLLSPNTPFVVQIGVPTPGNSVVQIPQVFRPGGVAVTATVSLQNSTPPGAAQPTTTAGSGQSRTVTIAVGQANSPASLAAGGIEFDPLAAGTAQVTADIPGFITTSLGGTRMVTVNP